MGLLNRKIIYSFIALMAISTLEACKKDFLEVTPKGVLVAEKVSDYNQLLNSLSTAVMPNLVSGDEAAGIEPYFTGETLPENQKSFRWENDIYLPDATSMEWTMIMQMIYQYNKVINEVMDAKDGSEEQKQSLMAEARACRAWGYFMMVNFYGKPYNEATAAADLAVPKVLISDVSQTKFTRATVKEIYDLVIDDLTASLPYLPTALTNRLRMSKPAAEGLLGKVYAFMGQYDKALPQLNAAINDLPGASIPVGLYDFQKELAPGGAFTPISPITGPSRGNLNIDQEVLFLRQTVNYFNFLFSGVVLNTKAVGLYLPGDYRRAFLTPNPFADFANVYPNGMLRTWGSGAVNNVGVSVPDIYLLRAECKSRGNDLAGAVADMEAFRKMRMPAGEAVIPAAIAADKVTLTIFILNERIREFPIQGYRWFDMRRLSVDPVYKSTVGTTHTVYDMNGTVKGTYTLRPERLVFRIPLYIANANPDIPQNP
ncbi:RagB/SusD family nutrient uptake outer membrane protein [Chitinophaga sp. 22321]|uniref:RagB/SusD family nutrient uptake outer membrane protein n=1 Tax=Chitinophaga hostae TaxID=2831022 RepID=A0ABS5JAC3_9BACT|nr:RagB/SusD family nutrient uptake outer membrane protein [Chitinophaga hostae]MBS0031392.1 RagB/SusD family nutrient uptake outer membrane protein [Chitinophaga hostae]